MMNNWKSISVSVVLAALAVAQGPATRPAARKGATTTTAPAEGARAVAVIREGTFLVDRVGRLTRAGDGQQWEFRLDAADGEGNRAAGTVTILPNLNLMMMESAVAANAREVRFKITGMVTEYRGRNYVLLQKVVVVPDDGQ